MGIEFKRATAILRGYDCRQTHEVASVLVGSLVGNMEVTLNTDGAFQTIKEIAAEFSGALNVGAGTVLSMEELKRAADAGISFALSPDMMTEAMIDFCRENEIVSIPGSLTPSEIRESFRRGADIVKVFPAHEVTRSYAAKVIAPLGDLRLMAVGGVRADNVAEFLAGGYRFVGSAGGIFKRADVIARDAAGLKRSLAAFEAALTSCSNLMDPHMRREGAQR